VSSGVEARVQLHGRDVGVLRYEKGGSSFSYEDDLARQGHQTLGQIFEDDPGKRRKVPVGLPDWFANLLPEGELRKQIIREIGGGYVKDFTLLLRLGADLPGAVTVHGATEPADDSGDDRSAEPTPADHPIRHSLAGVQLNAGMSIPRIQLVPASSIEGIPEGLADPEELIYLIERFDRGPSTRIHTEDFAQVADVPPIHKYSQSGATYDSMGNAILDLMGDAGYREYIERLTAMLIVGNTDAHLKNWSLIYPDGRTPSLSPVYDFHSLTVYSRYQFDPLALSIDGEVMTSSIYYDNFRKLAESNEFDTEDVVDIVGHAVERMRSAWSGELRVEAESRFPALARHFTGRLESLPICDV
jgi:serine/threonine-protein kinase HipA